MKWGFKSYNSWDPLKKCLVGNVYPIDFFAEHPDGRIADVLCKMNEESREDLNNLSSVLCEHGVDVYRTSEEIKNWQGKNFSLLEVMEDWGFIPKPHISPRDVMIVIGEQLILANKGYKPWCNYDSPWRDCDDFIDLSDDYNVDFPAAMRCGRDITVDVHAVNQDCERFLFDWLMPNNTHGFRLNTSMVGGHTDGVMSLVKPGLIVSHQDLGRFEDTYPGWEVIKAERPSNEYISAFQKFRNNNSVATEKFKKWWIADEEGNDALHKFIDLWMNESVGYAYETTFDVNCLSIDEKTIISNAPNPDLERQLKKYGVDLLVVPMRHRWFWDNGHHCVTVDLYREGEMVDYFPQRGNKNHDFGRLWKNGTLRRPL